jgi:DNA sulfur modification protein DndB
VPEIMNIGFYSFAAIAGQQGQHTYYLIQCPLRLVPRLFLFDEAEVPASLRKPRALDDSRVSDIAAYLTTRSDDYVLAPLVAVADGAVTFESISEDQARIGELKIPFTARLIIQDGQHRRAAINQLLKDANILEQDTIPVMLLPDPHLERSPRLYTDLNQEQGQRSRSQRILHDHSDLALLVRQLVDETPLFQDLTELERTTISNRSTALFTLSGIYQATQALLGIGKNDPVSFEQVAIAQQFWQELGQVIHEWQQIIQREVTASHLRQHYVHSHSVTLLAIGMVGHELIATYPDSWSEELRKLQTIDWSRDNTALWEGRAMVRGKMSKARDSVNLTAIAIKQAVGLLLTEKEQALEARLSAS